MISQRDLREWGFLAVLLILGILLMLIAGQFAIRLSPAWQVNADMRSNIDPNSQYAAAAAQGTRALAPLDQNILTPVAWEVFTPTPTPPGWQPPTATSTPIPTFTATKTAVPSKTSTPTATSTRPVRPLPSATNTNIPARGSITILTDSSPNDPQDFNFSGSLGGFNLDDDADPALSNAATFNNLAAGSYTVTQAAVSGWDLSRLFCSDPDGGSSINTSSRTAAIDLDPGETVACTFTNAKRGSIVIVENSLPNDPQDFAFSGRLGAFSLDDDSDPALPNTISFGSLEAGSYAVTQAVTGGWDLTGLLCSDPDGGSSINTSSRTATVDLDPGETVACTFTNTKRGSIVIVENSLPNDQQDFAFSGSLGAFNLDDDSNPALSDTATFDNLKTGTYTVTEAAVSGWTLTGLSCSDGSPTDLGTRTAAIHLDAGESITCTFLNAKPGTITIMETSQPNGPQDFAFSGNLGAFSLDDDSDPVRSNTASFSGVAAGTYTVTQAAVSGWDLVSIACADPDGGSPGNVGTRTATIDLEIGESILCTFTNAQRGSITIVKDSLPDDSQDFAFSGSLGVFSLDDDSDLALSNAAAFNDLLAGAYLVTETAVSGWSLTDLACTDGSTTNLGTGTAYIGLAPGENVTCTFTNAKAGSITVVKNTLGGDGTFGFNSAALGSFNLATAAGTASQAFTDLTPGTYAVAEDDPTGAGWDLTGLFCSDTSLTNLGTRTASITLDPGETVTCTFTDTKRGSIIIVAESLPENTQSFGFTGDLGAFSLDDDGTPPNSTTYTRAPGTYAVTENDPIIAGWDLTGISCSDTSPTNLGTRTASVSLGPGETVTCTFTNTKRGSITIAKAALGGDDTFSFTSGSLGNINLTTVAGAASQTFARLVPGAYAVAESDPTGVGWDLTGLACSDSSPVDLGTRSASVTLDPGEDLTCTFTNSKRGSITIVKTTTGNDASFSFSGALGTFSLSTVSGTASQTFNNLPVGSYAVSENALPGWALISTNCSDGSPVSAINVSPGESVTCTFKNTDRGTIVIVKDAVPNSAQDFIFSSSFGANFSLDNDSDSTLSDTATFTGQLAGTHTVTEGVVGGWNLTSIVCEDPDGGSSINIGSRTATINLDPNETVTCTFTNSAYTQINLSAGDDSYVTIPEGETWTTFLSTPLHGHGDDDWDLVFYEMYNLPCFTAYGSPICMDFIKIQVSTDGNTWYTIFYYGNGVTYNTSIAGDPESDNYPVPYDHLIPSPLMSLPTGIGIDIDNAGLGLPSGADFYYLRVYSPPSTGDGCEVDAIDIIP